MHPLVAPLRALCHPKVQCESRACKYVHPERTTFLRCCGREGDGQQDHDDATRKEDGSAQVNERAKFVDRHSLLEDDAGPLGPARVGEEGEDEECGAERHDDGEQSSMRSCAPVCVSHPTSSPISPLVPAVDDLRQAPARPGMSVHSHSQ